MNYLKYLIKGLSGEVYKYKNTIALYLAILAPVFIVFLNFNIYFFKGEKLIKAGQNPWLVYTFSNINSGLAILFPLFIILITVLINYIEHSSNTWKHLFTLPLPKSTTFLSKAIVSFSLVTISIFLFIILVIGSGYLLQFLRPELLLKNYSFIREFIFITLQSYVACLGMLAIQFWLSYRWKSVILPLGIGMAAFIFSLVLMQWEHIVYFPYSYPFIAATKVIAGAKGDFNFQLIDQFWYGLISGIFIFILAFYDSYKRNVV